MGISASDLGGSNTTTADALSEVGSYSSYDNPGDSTGPSTGEQKRRLEAFKKKQAKAKADAKEAKRFDKAKKKSGDRVTSTKSHQKTIAANKAENKQKKRKSGSIIDRIKKATEKAKFNKEFEAASKANDAQDKAIAFERTADADRAKNNASQASLLAGSTKGSDKLGQDPTGTYGSKNTADTSNEQRRTRGKLDAKAALDNGQMSQSEYKSAISAIDGGADKERKSKEISLSDAAKATGKGGLQGLVGGVGDLADLVTTGTLNTELGKKGREFVGNAIGENNYDNKAHGKNIEGIGDLAGSLVSGGGAANKVISGATSLLNTASKAKKATQAGINVAKEARVPAKEGVQRITIPVGNTSGPGPGFLARAKVTSEPSAIKQGVGAARSVFKTSKTPATVATATSATSAGNRPTTNKATNKPVKATNAKTTTTPKQTRIKDGISNSITPPKTGRKTGSANTVSRTTGSANTVSRVAGATNAAVSSGEGGYGRNSGGRTVEGPKGPAKDPKAPVASGEGGNKGLIKTQDELSATEASALNKRRRAKVTPGGAKSKLGTGGSRSPLSKLGGKQTKLKGSKGKDNKSTQQSTLLSVGDYFANRANTGARGGKIGL